MQKYPEQAFICKIIRSIRTFVHCKMHIAMYTLRANCVKVGGDLQTKQKKIHDIHLYTELIHYIHLYTEIVHSLSIRWAVCVAYKSMSQVPCCQRLGELG